MPKRRPPISGGRPAQAARGSSMRGNGADKVDFFVSYTQADRAWAEWIAWQLTEAGYTLLVQAWDFTPGSNFVHEMQRAAMRAERTIAVMSPAYFASPFAEAEWRTAFAKDPSGEHRRLMPVRIAEFTPPELMSTLVYIDLVGRGEAQARLELLRGVGATRARPVASPRFPVSPPEEQTGAPRFPTVLPQLPQTLEFSFVRQDIMEFKADVAIFKFARSFHGVDKQVARKLATVGVEEVALQPEVGSYCITSTWGALPWERVMYVGVPYLRLFGYPQIRSFASLAMQILAKELPSSSHVAMTLHGPNFGLDEIEAALSILAGCVEGFADYRPSKLRRVSIVERDERRLERLAGDLPAALETASHGRYEVMKRSKYEVQVRLAPAATAGDEELADVVGARSESKQHVFVAMPFGEEFADLFDYGIYQPVRAAGYRCERVDYEVFTGDVLERLKRGIETAAYVIAVLTARNPNVFLEVGYAWGTGRRTILVSRSGEELPFDVQGQRVLVHDSIRDLERKLSGALQALDS